MSIKGDMVASLCSRFGLSELDARAMVKDVIETANDPNFASRYAKEGGVESLDHDERMLQYWEVIKFLEDHI